jgi:hypothetical protein
VIVHSSNEFTIGNFYDVEIIDAEEYDLFAVPVGKEIRQGETNVIQNSLREEKVFWV